MEETLETYHNKLTEIRFYYIVNKYFKNKVSAKLKVYEFIDMLAQFSDCDRIKIKQAVMFTIMNDNKLVPDTVDYATCLYVVEKYSMRKCCRVAHVSPKTFYKRCDNADPLVLYYDSSYHMDMDKVIKSIKELYSYVE